MGDKRCIKCEKQNRVTCTKPTDRHIQTDRQIVRQTVRQTDRPIVRQTGYHTDRTINCRLKCDRTPGR